MIYAVIKTGGKQEKVIPGQRLRVEKLRGVGNGEEIEFTPLLVVRDGKVVTGDDLESVQVTARHLGYERGVKIRGFKYKAKTGYRRRWGHRQEASVVEIISIGGVGPAGEVTEPAKENAGVEIVEEAGEVEEADEKESPKHEEKKSGRKVKSATTAKESSRTDDESKKTAKRQTTEGRRRRQSPTSKPEQKKKNQNKE